MATVTIQDIKTFVTAPKGINLVVVKIETSTPGLVGWGCATFTWRCKAVVVAIDEYLKPMLLGRNVANIEDIWQSAMGSSYWRNGPVLNNALSGVDEALWDIKGKMAGMPLYDLFGGKCREGIAVYRHADGSCYEEVDDQIRAYLQEGYRYVRVHMGTYGGNMYGENNSQMHRPEGCPAGAYYDPHGYMRSVVKLFEHVRGEFGWELELLHDIHERLSLADTLTFAKEMEPFKLFFLEDALPPEQMDYFRYLREQTGVPLAMGELFTNPAEWRTAVQNQWIDFMRVHISDIGGLTPARKLAAFCDSYGVRTAFHGPSDLSPIGMTAQMHLDLAIPNFGIQEFSEFDEKEREVFPGCPVCRDGYVYLSDKPGIGVEMDEAAAKKYPYTEMDFGWLLSRLKDGTAVRP